MHGNEGILIGNYPNNTDLIRHFYKMGEKHGKSEE